MTISAAANPFDDRGGRVSAFDWDTDDLAAPGLDDVAADNGILGPVRAFHENVRLQRADHVVRSVFVEHNDRIDASQRFQNFYPLPRRRHRTARSFVRT